MGIPVYYQDLLKDIGLDTVDPFFIEKQLDHFLSTFKPFLWRKEHYAQFVAMCKGLLSDLQRKSMEPIACSFEGAKKVRNLANFLT
jgi:SRSO17 transposase